MKNIDKKGYPARSVLYTYQLECATSALSHLRELFPDPHLSFMVLPRNDETGQLHSLSVLYKNGVYAVPKAKLDAMVAWCEIYSTGFVDGVASTYN